MAEHAMTVSIGKIKRVEADAACPLCGRMTGSDLGDCTVDDLAR